MLTPEQLAGFAGVMLSLLFTYVPGLRVKFASFSTEAKSLTMLVLIVVVAVAALGLSCGNILTMFACTQQGAWGVAVMIFWAAVGNQTTYKLMPQPQDVQSAVAVRDMGFGAAPQHVSVVTGPRFVWRGRLGFILLALWCIVTALIGLGVPLQALSPALNWVLLAAGILILIGV